MAEDNKKISPEADPQSADIPAKDEAIGEITDALEKKLHENEEENTPTAEPPKRSDDDILNELKEALDKAENNEGADDILTGGSLKQSDSAYEHISQEDFKLPQDVPEDDPAANRENEANAPDKESVSADLPEQTNDFRPIGNVNAAKKRPQSSEPDNNGSKRAKKSSPAKIIFIILALLLVAAGAFALVHYVIAPNIGSSGSDAGKTGSQSGAANELETAPVAPTESGYTQMASNAMKEMSRREKICQLFIVTPEMLTNEELVTGAADLTKNGLESYPVGGVIYTQQNILGEDQAKAMISNTQSFSKIPLFISVDDDGVISAVQDGQSAIGNTTEDTYNSAVESSGQKHNIGFNLDFSLDADLLDAKEKNPNLTDADANSLLSSAIKGYNESGVIPSLKYFPGKKTDKDDSGESEDGFVHITRTADELDNGSEFSAFRSAIESGVGMIMVDHVFVDKLDDEKPATLSSKLVPELLRKKLNYQGVAVTGNMSADYFTTSYKYSTIVKGIFDSDIDMILNPNSIQSYVEEIESMMDSGTITEEQLDTKVKRILTLKYQSGVIGESNGSTDSSEAAE